MKKPNKISKFLCVILEDKKSRFGINLAISKLINNLIKILGILLQNYYFCKKIKLSILKNKSSLLHKLYYLSKVDLFLKIHDDNYFR